PGAVRKPRQPNPVYEHLTRRRRWPSVRMALILCFISSIACSLGPAAVWKPPDGPAPWGEQNFSTSAIPAALVITLFVLVTLVSPLAIALVSGSLAARSIRDDATAMIQHSGGDARVIVTGVLYAILFCARLLWALYLGLLLPMVTAVT